METATTTGQITIGQGGIATAPLGVGTWAWGDRRLWNYGQGYGREDLAGAFEASVAAGVTLFDTAEIYGRGKSERILGALVRATSTACSVFLRGFVAQFSCYDAKNTTEELPARCTSAPAIVATKFAPYPWRFSARTLRGALDTSLRRLGLARVDLYQIHFPYTILSIPALMDALADAVAEGKVRAVGVSNYSAPQMQRAHEALARRGIPLASNQVQYSLLWRQPERNGVLATCQALGVTLIAYSPLAQGRLTGTYGPGNRPSDWRRWQPDFSEANLRRNAGLLDLLRGIGQDHGGKTVPQVALNLLIRQAGVLPIPGAKTAAQAVGNAGALGWALTQAEVTALRAASAR